MEKKYNPYNIPFAKNLRKEMTKEERKLWYEFLRYHRMKFRRQAVIGRYIVDFYCPQIKLVIELDGSQHFEEDAVVKDAERDKYIENYGIKIFRVQNIDINRNFRGVCETIDNYIKELNG